MRDREVTGRAGEFRIENITRSLAGLGKVLDFILKTIGSHRKVWWIVVNSWSPNILALLPPVFLPVGRPCIPPYWTQRRLCDLLWPMKCGWRWCVSLLGRSFKSQHMDHTFSSVMSLLPWPAMSHTEAPPSARIPKWNFHGPKPQTCCEWAINCCCWKLTRFLGLFVTTVLPNLFWQIQRILEGLREHDQICVLKRWVTTLQKVDWKETKVDSGKPVKPLLH